MCSYVTSDISLLYARGGKCDYVKKGVNFSVLYYGGNCGRKMERGWNGVNFNIPAQAGINELTREGKMLETCMGCSFLCYYDGILVDKALFFQALLI